MGVDDPQQLSVPDLSAPASNEVEVSLFGPGLGEAIAVHVGGGEWLLIDSCFDDAGLPASLAYLAAIGADLDGVSRVVATHWDDDHIGGLAACLRSCQGAAFCCSGALRPDEFLLLTETVGRTSMILRSGLSEFAELIDILRSRRARGERFPAPRFATAGRPMWERPASHAQPAASLTALSPSDNAVVLAQRALAELIPRAGDSKRKVRAPSPNHASVVLDLTVGEVQVLLGADLENTADPTTGWTAILDGDDRPTVSASAFKVPHHGSDDADEPRVWDELLDPAPAAILAPFVQGSVSLPRVADRARLLARTPDVFTTSAQPRRRRNRPTAVQRTLREAGITVTDADPPMGQIRLRRQHGVQGWGVALIGPAARLSL